MSEPERLPDWLFENDGLRLCGCGDPEGMTFWLRDVLRTMTHTDTGGQVAEGRKRRERLIGWSDAPDEGFAALFVMYELDARGWTEHGSNVAGSWLTPEGEAMLAKLESFCAEYEQSADPKGTT